MPGPESRPGLPAPAPQLLAPGDLLLGRYRVARVIGEGGMGQIYAATHVELDQQVAIKILLPERAKDAEAVERFLREARAVALLKSAHVARVFDVGTSEAGLPYMVMELLEGEDLASIIDRGGPLPYAEAVDAVLQACDAVAEAHAKGVIHRDLKPENLFVTTRRDGAPLVKVLDFGISKIGGDPAVARKRGRIVTQDNVVLGSPGYMSPEQVKSSARVDERSDVWSLGVTLYELLTCRDAFDGETMADVFVSILTGAPPPPSQLAADVPPELDAIVMRCLEKDPAARFQSVAELAQALSVLVPGSSASMGPGWGRHAAPSSSSLLARMIPGAFEPPPLSAVGMSTTIEERRPGRGRALLAVAAAALVAALLVAGIAVRGAQRGRAAASSAPATSEAAPVSPAPPPAAVEPPPPQVSASAVVQHPAPEPPPARSAAPAPKPKPAARPRPPATSAKPTVAPSALPRQRTSW